MNLEQFAKLAGVVLVDCDPGWGGRIGYKTQDCPSATFCGYRTAGAAYKAWLKDTFGEHAAKAVMKLLKPTPLKEPT
jgi:hypothetical protein